ncbi:MAG: toll/interleukin-1 receptor domain-containing protein [Clostridiales bacterium]|nr:toll/interleukin-1 receptor domain-containing protein [Clostridiales bacterium]
MHDIFLSYSRKDKQIATMVLSILEQNGIKCWIDYRDIPPGENYGASIVRAIKECKIFVLLLSKSSGKSSHVLNEVNSAASAEKPIVPFKIDDVAVSEDLEYYVGRTHWLEAITPPMEAHINSLAENIKRLSAAAKESGAAKDAGQPQTPPAVSGTAPVAGGCKMMTFQELLSMGFTAFKIASQLVENDYINCNGIDESNEGTAEQWEKFLQDESDTFRYLVNSDNRIVGDWSIVALTDEANELALKGELLEKDISTDNTVMVSFSDVYNGYILAISLLPEYRNMQNYNLIMDSFFEQLEVYAENGIFFRSWCINVFGREVEALVKRLGFTYVCDNKEFGKIYTCPFMPLPDIPMIKKRARLVELYAAASANG